MIIHTIWVCIHDALPWLEFACDEWTLEGNPSLHQDQLKKASETYTYVREISMEVPDSAITNLFTPRVEQATVIRKEQA